MVFSNEIFNVCQGLDLVPVLYLDSKTYHCYIFFIFVLCPVFCIFIVFVLYLCFVLLSLHIIENLLNLIKLNWIEFILIRIQMQAMKISIQICSQLVFKCFPN